MEFTSTEAPIVAGGYGNEPEELSASNGAEVIQSARMGDQSQRKWWKAINSTGRIQACNA